jgi:hypothetical protein
MRKRKKRERKIWERERKEVEKVWGEKGKRKTKHGTEMKKEKEIK